MDALKCAKEICQELRSSGHTAYFAGGWVRDYLLGISSSDIDIATDAEPEEIVKIFPDHVLVGAQFGVVLVLYGPFQFEVATFRQDVQYKDGRTPSEVILKSSPEEDAKRRDFTINGMFFDPVTEKIYDFVGGRADLEKKILRCIGDPKERFQEDRLRMLRAIRFAHRFGFTIDESTRKATAELSHTLLPAVSMERIWQELSKMRKAPLFKEALLELHALGLLGVIFPPLKNVPLQTLTIRLEGIETLQAHVPAILFLVKLFDIQDESFVQNLQNHLKASRVEGKWIEAYLAIRKLVLENAEPYDLAHLFANSHFEIVFEVLLCEKSAEEKNAMLAWYKKRHHELEFFIHRLRKKEPLVASKDLIALGIQPGKEMGKLLQEAEKIGINQHLIEKHDILSKLQKTPLWPSV